MLSIRTFQATALGLLSTLSIASAHDGPHPPPVRVEDEVAHRPTAIPDRIILGFSGDPARSQAVAWRTDTTVTEAVAQIALAEDGPKFVEKARQLKATTSSLVTNLGAAHFHTAEFRDLQPSTDYLYRVGDGVNWSEWIRFRTASDRPEPFSFIYFGDAQTDLKQHWSRVIREAYSDAPKAKFLLHAGDLVNRGDSDHEWGDWFRAGGWVNAMIPSFATPGNHEYRKLTDETRTITPHWRRQFALPTNGPAGLEETAYYIDYQGARIVSLNSNERHEAQAAWLDSILSDNPNRWTILTFHHPIYNSAKGRDNKELRDLWQPVFDRHHVDLVLQGHDHTYARSGLITFEENLSSGATARNGDSGTVYVVSVSGPKMYDLTRDDWMVRAATDTQLYQIISIDGDSLGYQARTATGKLYDAFRLRKRPGQPNELLDGVPSTPENLRPEPPAEESAAGR